LKIVPILSIVLLVNICKGQQFQQFDISTFNKKYLEHLVKTGVDSVRKSHKCQPLINDSILYIASNHHAQYLVKTRKLTHTEDNSDSTKTPQDRAEYYGAVNYRVGENILFTPYNQIVEGKDKTRFDTHSYQGIADAMVSAWVHSPGHFKNMITSEYQLTGLSVAIDTVTGRMYACQNFAVADYRYTIRENKTMFPFSNYEPPAPVNSFEGIKMQLLGNYKYDYNLRHDNQEKCLACRVAALSPPPLTLRIEKDKFILRIEDSEYVKNLMNEKHDGFAVEIVSFDDYMCGNPAYYTKPSRRNGQLMLNGRILQPLYRNDLYEGYKKRKKKNDVKFVKYIFNSDSVSFFKRFGKYRLDRFNSEYFEISLGKIPKDINGLWAHNLVYIQDKQICHIDYFTSYCGDVIDDYQTVEFIPPAAEGHCEMKPEQLMLHFSVPFEQGKSDFTKEDISPFIQSISDLKYDVDSVHIYAYSSIEGDSVLNRNLQIMRSKNIVNVLKQNQISEIPVSISTSADWTGFYEEIGKSAKWKYLSAMNRGQVLEELNKIGVDKLEPILKMQRRGKIDLYCTITVTDQNLKYLLPKELIRIQKKIDSLTVSRQLTPDVLNEFRLLYECIHSKVVQKKMDPEFLASVKMPKTFQDNHPLVQDFIMYGYEFGEAFSKNHDWKENHKKYEDFIRTQCNEPSHIKPDYQFLQIRNTIDNYREKKLSDYIMLQNLLDKLSGLEDYYRSDSLAQLNIDRLNFNINVLLLNSVFAGDRVKNSSDAIKSIAQLQQFYEKHNQVNADRLIKLGKTAVFFDQIPHAIELLTPYATNDSVMAYIMPLGYQKDTTEEAIGWYQSLIKLSDKMDPDMWCNMFFDQCKIPFQAFDYDPLRTKFCEKCMERNEFIKGLIGKHQDKRTNTKK
jgi:hypothetical protein